MDTGDSHAAGPRKALITGVTGQDGSYLAELLLAKGYEVWGIVRQSSSKNTSRIDHLLSGEGVNGRKLKVVSGDLCDTASLVEILKTIRPDELYHLGSQSHVQVSFESPEYTGDVVGLGTIRLLEAIRKLDLPTRFFGACSSEIFGKAAESPQTEQTPFHPRNPYGVAKVYAFHSTINYRESYGMFAVNGILYNHESPRRGESFVTRKITRAIGKILTGEQQSVLLGNLDVRRDWGFAGDYVRGMWQMLQAESPDDFILATGETHSLREFCELAFQHVGMPISWRGAGIDEVGVTEDGRSVVQIDPNYFRPTEANAVCGDATKARQKLRWSPEVSFEGLVQMMVDHDVALARHELNRA
ncbi:GDP-mannose 4,6-dehydratase [Planctomicrobium sp. SH661]|uniref:GDP-mannose 4,6-dehydratase n=1 Tax=Planctomicrobium sp. SH661 TaxID=3448124 RepID=UPI003F5BB54B